MYWNSEIQVTVTGTGSWIVTLDVLKFALIIYLIKTGQSWIVTLDVLKLSTRLLLIV